MTKSLRRMASEPLLHFMLLGAAIFAIYTWRSRSQATQPSIDVSAGQVKLLAEVWRRQWQRPPSADELRASVDQYVREEILYRRALALGLDRDDSVVRQRLAQKMQFLSEDVVEVTEPDETALRAYFAAHVESYLEPAALTFSHVYWSRAARGAGADAEAKAALDVLARRPDAAADLGDAFVLPFDFARMSATDVASQFGAEFATSLRDLPVGTWQGPIASTYGVHLVRVTERAEARRPELAQVRDRVIRDYQLARREESNRALMERLRAGYRVAVDKAAIQAATADEVARARP